MSLGEHIRYLESRLAGCVPESLHREQIAAYRAAIAAARAAASDAEYLAATANLLELTRAEWLDRYRTAARFYDSIGDGVRAEIARDNAAAAEGAGDHAELVRAIIAAKLESRRRREGIEDAAAQIPVLVLALIGLRLEPHPEAQLERRAELGAIWREMAGGDRRLEPARLLDYPPYRARLPFGAEGARALVGWLEELDLPAPGPEAEPPVEIPSIEIPISSGPPSAGEVAAPYRAAAAAIDPDTPELAPLRDAYRRIDALAAGAADGDALLAAMAAEDLFVTIARAPLLAGARATRDAVDGDQVALRAHLDRQIAALSAARSVAELELVALAADEHLAIESTWSHLLFSIALMPIAAVLAYDVDRSDWRLAHLRRCEALVADLLGAATRALLEVDAVWRVFVREVFGRGQVVALDAPIERSVHRGETALSIAGHVQAATVQWAIAEASRSRDPEAELLARLRTRRFATPEAMRDHILGILADAGLAAAAPLRSLEIWGEPLAPDALEKALIDPPRPALPI